jgi:hypothetical protein
MAETNFGYRGWLVFGNDGVEEDCVVEVRKRWMKEDRRRVENKDIVMTMACSLVSKVK